MKPVEILIVEDEEAIRDMLRFSLPAAEFIIYDAESTSQAITILKAHQPKLIILDWMLPGKSGIDFIRWLKQQDAYKNIPIIMLTARAEEENKVKALLTGADDYVTKPFSPNELYARMKAILRRGNVLSDTPDIVCANIRIRPDLCRIYVQENELDLTPIEYKMLHFLITHADKVYSRDQLISHIWGTHTYIDERTVDVQVKRLRQKLKPHGHDKRIKTIRSLGYAFMRECDEEKQHS